MLQHIARALSLLALAVSLFTLGSVIGSACKPAQNATDAVCEALIAYNDTPLEEQICATADDLLAIGNLILGNRATKAHAPDAGPGPKTSTCKVIPRTDVCATDEELAAAIKARKAGAK